MLVDIHTSAAQLKAAARWAQDGEGMAEVMLAVDAEGYLTAGQGDERAVIGETGELIEGEAGIEPLSVPEALTLNNTGQDALILAAEAILGELAGRIEETDPDGAAFHEAMDTWDQWRHEATTLARAAGKTPDDPMRVSGGTLGDREAATWDDAEGSTCQHCGGAIPADREHCPDCGKRSEMLNDVAPVDAEDEDGVPIFSDETRAAAQADPRGERDR